MAKPLNDPPQLSIPFVVPKQLWTLDELKAALIGEFPQLSTEEGQGCQNEVYLKCWPGKKLPVSFLGASPHALPGRKSRSGDLLCCEIFSGRSAIYWAYRSEGLQCERFDTRVHDSHNIHEKDGVYKVARMIARVDPQNGVTVLEPTCASWTWINRGTSLRSVEPVFPFSLFLSFPWVFPKIWC